MMAILYIILLTVLPSLTVSQGQIAIRFPDEIPVQVHQQQVRVTTPPPAPPALVQVKPKTSVDIPPGLSNITCGEVVAQQIRWSSDGELGDWVYPYHLNVTADRLRSEGFEVTVTEMERDEIYSMTFFNATFSGNVTLITRSGHFIIGGHNASEERALSMALIGQKKSDKTQWFCGGVLINQNWVLSAAHCLLTGLTADVIRLGEYDSSHTEESLGNDVKSAPYYNQMMDYEIEKIVAHPEFVEDLEERYHDLVLFKLKKPAPFYSVRIRPICLPWGEPEPDNLYGLPPSLIGSNVTVTGWGATSFGSLEPAVVLQEVDLEVFDTNVCDKAYQQLNSFVTKYPRGMSENEILCAGAKEGGKDACQGDSGGPLVYQKTVKHRILDPDLILAGIVSAGFGCGDKEFPGLYIPVHKPWYLEWIKEVAFKEYL